MAPPPNGTLCNGIFAILLILSYASSSIILIPADSLEIEDTGYVVPDGTVVHYVVATPMTILGVVILLQAIITLLAMRTAKVMIWSSSPIDTTVTCYRMVRLHGNLVVACAIYWMPTWTRGSWPSIPI